MSDETDREAEALFALQRDDEFRFLLSGGRGFILDFDPARDTINLQGLGLTPWDLLPSTNGADLILSFDGGEVVLRGASQVDPAALRFTY